MAYSYSNENKKEIVKKWISRFFRKIKDLKSNVKQKSGLSEYTEPKPARFNKKLPKLPIKRIGIIVVLILVVLSVGFGISGMMSHMERLETDLNSTQIQLKNTKQEKENCKEDLVSCAERKSSLQENLSSTKSTLEICQYELDITNETLVETNETLDECLENQSLLEQDVEQLEDEVESEEEDYTQLVKKSVKQWCCNSVQINNGTKINYGIGSNSINCDGSDYYLNCSSKETDFSK